MTPLHITPLSANLYLQQLQRCKSHSLIRGDAVPFPHPANSWEEEEGKERNI
jgi:hypothetical protein